MKKCSKNSYWSSCRTFAVLKIKIAAKIIRTDCWVRFTKVESGCDAFGKLKAKAGQTQCGKFFLGKQQQQQQQIDNNVNKRYYIIILYNQYHRLTHIRIKPVVCSNYCLQKVGRKSKTLVDEKSRPFF